MSRTARQSVICGGVLVPQAHPTTGRFRRCFVEEARKDVFTTYDLRLERDHFVPRSLGGADGPTHLVHAYCQRVQGGLIGGLITGPINIRATNAILTPEQRCTGAALVSPERRRANSRLGGLARAVALTPEQRSAHGRAMNAARTPEQRSAHGRVGARAGNCARWNVGRGKPCTCGRHT